MAEWNARGIPIWKKQQVVDVVLTQDASPAGLPSVNIFTGASVDVWQTLGDDLMQSSWAVSTRRLYQGWLRAYVIFCDWCASPALPVVPIVLRDWLTRIAANYASGRPASPAHRPKASAQPVRASRPSKMVAAKGPTVPSSSPQDKPVSRKVQPFPLKWKSVGDQPVCVRYQLGCCRSAACPHAHVCHACGKRHPGGRLCRSAILRAASGWKPM